MPKAICPFAEGDRVDHKIFGLGTVIDAPAAMSGPSANNRGAKIKDGVSGYGGMMPRMQKAISRTGLYAKFHHRTRVRSAIGTVTGNPCSRLG